ASQTYTFNYVVSDGCAVDQATSTVTVYAAPSAGTDGSITVCLNEPFDLLTGIGGNIDLGGTWYNPSNQALPGSLDTSGSLAGQYNYDYIVTSTICPNDTANVIVIVDGSCDYTASLDELSSQWEVYPNPATSILTVLHQGIKVSSIEMFDLNGKLLFTINTNGQVEQSFNVSSLQPGMYIIQLNAEGQTSNKRVIKQ
ncbi:MAG: T9SS type A sorting domain-containing protein, partial [Flavobacteriia bacterium]